MLNSNDPIQLSLYVQNYLDAVENLPDDVERQISRLLELDVTYRSLIKEAAMYKTILEKDELERFTEKKMLTKLEKVLICLQEIGDEKVIISQNISDIVDNKYRSLEDNLRELGAGVGKLDLHKEDENVESGAGSTGKESNKSESANLPQSSSTNERSKRSRRNRGDDSSGSGLVPENDSQKRRSAGGNKTKKKQRKNRSNNHARDESPQREEETISRVVPAEPDEPTYCLCDQISYGEMIMCDNDLCPIEWFHFVCVNLSTKPKGKWYCPKCRGDRQNVMKPKPQFLKELEKYNKEKEEKS